MKKKNYGGNMDEVEKLRKKIQKLDEEAELLRKQVEEKQEIERLTKLLKEKEQEVKQLKSKIKPQFTFNFPSVLKKAVPVAITVLLLFSVLTFITPVSRAASPVVAYSSITDGEQFVDVIPGEGVYLTVNVSDSDGNLQSVDIYTNASGSWSSIYSSGALGGVSYHNTSSFLVSSWTGSWTKYWFNITANDGSDTEFVYSFTTEYVWGQPHLIVLNDTVTINRAVILKNDTSDYYVWSCDSTNHKVKCVRTDDLSKTVLLSPEEVETESLYIFNSFVYNNTPHVYYYYDDYLRYAYYDGSSWHTGSTGISQHAYHSPTHSHYYAYGADVKYYDGKWQIAAGHATSAKEEYMSTYASSTPYSGETLLKSVSGVSDYPYPSLAIYKGILHCVWYNGGNDDLHWWTYDGATWTDQGKLALDIDTGGCAIVHDIRNDNLVLFYINGSNVLKYRVYDGSSWSTDYTVFTPLSGKDINYLNAEYVDGRIIVTFSYDLRGNYNVYYIATPEYVYETGLNTTLHRIQWVDAAPGSTNVNSTVVSFKNMNDRDIKNITWHFEDIGDITVANNVRVWSNMSGSWQSWSVGSDGNTSKIDISTVKGSEWSPGETLYWKFEILNVGSVAETLHATDEDIYMLIEF
ncbi:MAG: hypothetical protein DRM98_00245 [Thermoplasmata archaeon]|nr:MAG: hypothetical protein DRM98_00245 [Thermoplasmata archaeon]